jgi:hypothetical protein
VVLFVATTVVPRRSEAKVVAESVAFVADSTARRLDPIAASFLAGDGDDGFALVAAKTEGPSTLFQSTDGGKSFAPCSTCNNNLAGWMANSISVGTDDLHSVTGTGIPQGYSGHEGAAGSQPPFVGCVAFSAL